MRDQRVLRNTATSVNLSLSLWVPATNRVCYTVVPPELMRMTTLSSPSRPWQAKGVRGRDEGEEMITLWRADADVVDTIKPLGGLRLAVNVWSSLSRPAKSHRIYACTNSKHSFHQTWIIVLRFLSLSVSLTLTYPLPLACL